MSSAPTIDRSRFVIRPRRSTFHWLVAGSWKPVASDMVPVHHRWFPGLHGTSYDTRYSISPSTDSQSFVSRPGQASSRSRIA